MRLVTFERPRACGLDPTPPPAHPHTTTATQPHKCTQVQIYTSLGYSTCSQSGRPNPLPGSFGHEAQDAAWYASIGADGMKGDW